VVAQFCPSQRVARGVASKILRFCLAPPSPVPTGRDTLSPKGARADFSWFVVAAGRDEKNPHAALSLRGMVPLAKGEGKSLETQPSPWGEGARGTRAGEGSS